jgi:membrane protease YdiL (CAAX protease family)
VNLSHRTVRSTAPWRFFLLVFLLSVPFYLLGLTRWRLPELPMLPASALMTFVPLLAVMILAFGEHGDRNSVDLAKRLLGVGTSSSAFWLLFAFLFMPLVCVVEFAVLRSTGSALPVPQITAGEALFLFLAFFIGAIGEEVGWQGYAYPALRTRMSTLISAIVLGIVWAIWHVVPFVQLGRSTEWILWHSLSAVALRIIMVWLFENTRGSLLVAVLFHTMINVSWALFPNAGSFYNPFITFVILTLAVGLIIFFGGLPRRPMRNSASARAMEGTSHV